MSPIDHYYEVLDYINELEKDAGLKTVSNGAPVDRIDNNHRIAKHLYELFKLSKEAEREYWESIDVRLDEE